MDGDAYSDVYAVFNRLCPQLVPKPLWGVSLAKLVRMKTDDLIYFGLELEVIEKLKSFWFKLPRDKCAVCGSRASDIDEFWSYYVVDGRGIARLVSLRSLCSHCHLAKHIGYASNIGKRDVALEHLTKINNITLLDVERLLDKIYDIWDSLSSITAWRIEISEGVLPEDIRVEVESGLNRLLKKKYTRKSH
jgi:hypothetical protein